MDQKNILKVGVIGCGRIGSLWDESDPNPNSPAKTHEKAYRNNPATQLTGFCDADSVRATEAATKWSVPFSTSDLSEFLKKDFDIISICTPVDQRSSLLKKISENHRSSALLIEKPIAPSLKEAVEIKQLLEIFDLPAVINYTRRYTPGIQRLRAQIKQQKWGTFQAGTAYYGNGFLNNGSHMVDLLCYLLGPIEAFSKSTAVKDNRIGEDETISVQLNFPSGSVYMHGLDHRNFTVFELDLLFSKGRIRLTDRAMVESFQTVIEDPVYDGFKILGPPHVSSTEYEKSMENAIAEVVAIKNKNLSLPSCTAEDAVAVTSIIENIRSSK
jgi:predicted dehydrogenase